MLLKIYQENIAVKFIMKGMGIFGGTFDPIHLGHLIIAEQTRDNLELEKIIFIPNGNPPHKNSVSTDKKFRLEMIKLAIEDNTKFAVSEIETNKEGPCYTVDTIAELKQSLDKEMFFIMGADSLINIKSWHRYEELLDMCRFAVFPRIIENQERTAEYQDSLKLRKWIDNNLKTAADKFIFIDFPMLDISSTDVRKKIEGKKSLKYLVPDPVIKYINKKKLY
jgi:nicotinate-nucleotide adenylyltransferase